MARHDINSPHVVTFPTLRDGEEALEHNGFVRDATKASVPTIDTDGAMLSRKFFYRLADQSDFRDVEIVLTEERDGHITLRTAQLPDLKSSAFNRVVGTKMTALQGCANDCAIRDQKAAEANVFGPVEEIDPRVCDFCRRTAGRKADGKTVVLWDRKGGLTCQSCLAIQASKQEAIDGKVADEMNARREAQSAAVAEVQARIAADWASDASEEAKRARIEEVRSLQRAQVEEKRLRGDMARGGPLEGAGGSRITKRRTTPLEQTASTHATSRRRRDRRARAKLTAKAFVPPITKTVAAPSAADSPLSFEMFSADIRQGEADGINAAILFIGRLQGFVEAKSRDGVMHEHTTLGQHRHEGGDKSHDHQAASAIATETKTETETETETKAHPDQDKDFTTFAAGQQFLSEAGFTPIHVITRSRTRATVFENESGERRALVQSIHFNGKPNPSTRLTVMLHKSAPIMADRERAQIFEQKMAQEKAKLAKLKAKSIDDHTVYERRDAEAWSPYARAEDFADTVLRAHGFDRSHQPIRDRRDGRKWAYYVTTAPTVADPQATSERILIIDGEKATIRVPKTPMGLRPDRDRVDQEIIEARAGFRAARAKMVRPRDWFDSLPSEINGDAAREAHARYQEAIPTKRRIGAMAKIIANRSRQLSSETKEARRFETIKGFGAALAARYGWPEGKGVLLVQQAVEHGLTSGEMFGLADYEQARLFGHSRSPTTEAV